MSDVIERAVAAPVVVQRTVSNVGAKGDPGAPGVIAATAPVTLDAGVVGFDQDQLDLPDFRLWFDNALI